MGPSTYLIVAGNLGTGKTTVAERLRQLIPGSRLFLEAREEALGRFYTDPIRLAFALQLAYSLQYLEQAVGISRTEGVVVQDRSIFDTHEVFSRLRHRTGAIDDDQLGALDRIFRIAVNFATPSHLVLLDAPVDVSLQRVMARAISDEMGVTSDLLRELRDAYLQWYGGFDLCPKLRIDTGTTEPEEVVSTVCRFIGASASGAP